MKRIFYVTPFAIVLAGIGIIAYYSVKLKQQKQERQATEVIVPEATAPASEHLTRQDQLLVQETFNTPESLDAASVPEAPVAAQDHASLSHRPALMAADLEGYEEDRPYLESDIMKAEPAMAASFSSLRKDAVKSPTSEQNRAAVNRIARSRQERIKELNYSKIEL